MRLACVHNLLAAVHHLLSTCAMCIEYVYQLPALPSLSGRRERRKRKRTPSPSPPESQAKRSRKRSECSETLLVAGYLTLRVRNSLGPIANIFVMRLSALSLLAMSFNLEIGSASAEWAGQGKVGGWRHWVHPKGVSSMATSGLISRNNLVGTGRRAISALFGVNGVRNKQSNLVGPPFPAFKARFLAVTG